MISIKGTVRFGETDMMGLIYHPNLLCYLEMGRIAYLQAFGITLEELLAAGIAFPLRDCQVSFRKPLTYGDGYEVRTRLADFNRAKMEFTYKVIRTKDGETAAQGSTVNVFTDGKGRILRLPQLWCDKLFAALRQEREEGGHERIE